MINAPLISPPSKEIAIRGVRFIQFPATAFPKADWTHAQASVIDGSPE
jgi:hypothetical protein